MNLLVVDFDQFFPAHERPQDDTFPGEWSLFDWGHSEEDPFFYEAIWPIRASAFLRNGKTLPGVDRERMQAFWGRFKFAPHAQLLYADSNMYAAHETVREGIKNVWLFDAHHDCGYHPDAIDRMLASHEINCGNWMLHYAMTDTELHMRYPQWRSYALEVEPTPLVPLDRQVDDGTPPMVEVDGRIEDVVFDRVFLCKSPAWVPSWCDLDWHRFLSAAPFRRKIAMDGSKRVRAFDMADVEARVEQERQVFEGVPDGADRG